MIDVTTRTPVEVDLSSRDEFCRVETTGAIGSKYGEVVIVVETVVGEAMCDTAGSQRQQSGDLRKVGLDRREASKGVGPSFQSPGGFGAAEVCR